MSSSKQHDSDLYGDIYSDDLIDFQDDVEVPAADGNDDDDDKPTPTAASTASSSKLPTPPASGDEQPATSYSAQIAQQFSAYKQDPAQERQPKVATSSIASFTGGAATTSGLPDAHGTVFGKKPSEMHDSGKLFVGGLSWDTTDEGLRDYFEQYGKVDALTIMRDPATGTSRGFAFLTFEDASCADAVIGKEHVVDGKNIDPKRAIPRDEHLRNTRYFVGGLSHSTTPDTMKAFFATYGKVVDATVMLDRESGRSKGFGFVTFEDAGPNLDSLVVGKGLVLDEKEIEVKPAQPRSQRESAHGTTRNLVNTIKSSRSSTPDTSRGGLPSKVPGLAGPMGGMNAMAGLNAMGLAGGLNPAMGAAGMMGGAGAMGGMGGGMNPMAAMMLQRNMMNMGMGGMQGMQGNMAGAMGGMQAGNMGQGAMGGMGAAGMGGMMNPMMMGMMGMGQMPGQMGGGGMGGGGMGGGVGLGAVGNGTGSVGMAQQQQNQVQNMAANGMSPQAQGGMSQMSGAAGGMNANGNPTGAMGGMGMGMGMPGMNMNAMRMGMGNAGGGNRGMGGMGGGMNPMAGMMGGNMGMMNMANMAGMAGMGMGMMGNMGGGGGGAGGMGGGGMKGGMMGGGQGTGGVGPVRMGQGGRKSAGFHPYSR